MANCIYPIDLLITPEQEACGTVGTAWCLGFADGWPCFDSIYYEISMKDLIIQSAYRGGLILKIDKGEL